MRETASGNTGIKWRFISYLKDFDFAGETALFCNKRTHPGQDKQTDRRGSKSRIEVQYAEVQSNENQQEEQRSSDIERGEQ